MNKWSKSLPSINVLTDDTKLNIKPIRFRQTKVLSSNKTLINNTKINSKPIRIPQSKISTNDDSDSLTDVSLISPTKPSPINIDQSPKFYNSSSTQYDSVIEIDAMSHNEFVPVDQLYDSLFAYANSFHIDDTIYSSQDADSKMDSPSTLKQQSESISNHMLPTQETTNLMRHKSCEDILQMNKPTSILKSNVSDLKQSHVYSPKKTERDDIDNGNHSDESTTVTDGSRFQWEYVSDGVDHLNKSSINITNNYQVTTRINPSNVHYSQDSEQRTSTNSSQKISLSPIIIREKTKDLYIQQNIDIQLLRPSTPPLPTAPIIIREVLHKPCLTNQLSSKQQQQQQSTSTSLAAFTEYGRSSKPPAVPKPRPSSQSEQETNQPSKEIIIEYNQVNVTIAKNINQRDDIKRVKPDQYIQQHGSSLYPNEVFHDILTNIIS